MGLILNRGKNYIINGAMDFWQRGTSFAAAGNGQYTADRFVYQKLGTFVHTISQDTDVPTVAQAGFLFPYSLRLNLTTPQTSFSSNERCQIIQKIEGQVFAPLRNRTFTLSFWVKATATGTYSMSIGDSSSSVTYLANYTINTTNTWEKKIITITHSDSNGAWNYTTGSGLQVRWTIASGPSERSATTGSWLVGDFKSSTSQVNGVNTGATDFRITGVMINEGAQASRFGRAGGTVVDEFRLCQRYLQRVSGMYLAMRYASGGSHDIFGKLNLPMRSTPAFVNLSSAVVSSGSVASNAIAFLRYGNAAYVTHAGATAIQGQLYNDGSFIVWSNLTTSSAPAGEVLMCNMTASDALLFFDAEL